MIREWLDGLRVYCLVVAGFAVVGLVLRMIGEVCLVVGHILAP